MRTGYRSMALIPLGQSLQRGRTSSSLLLSTRTAFFASLRRKRSDEAERTEAEAEAEDSLEAVKAAHQQDVQAQHAAAAAGTPPVGGPRRAVRPNTSETTLSAIATASVEEQLRAQTEHLKRELRHSEEVIRQLVSLVDRDRHAADLEKLGRSMEGGGGLFIAEDSQMLLKGLRTPGARVVLLEGHSYLLDLFDSVRISNTSVSIIGNGATVVGSITLDKGATLDVSNVFFFAPNGQREAQLRALPPGAEPRVVPNVVAEPACPAASEQASNAHILPILSATNGSRLFVNGCQLVNGRDGVYLGINSTAELCSTAVRNCIRGVYEGVGCRVGIAPDCHFSSNYYHMVLLGQDKRGRLERLILPNEENRTAGLRFSRESMAEEVCPPGFTCATPVRLRKTRADVVLEHDPIQDVYSECWIDGKPVELDESLRTASLSDPVY